MWYDGVMIDMEQNMTATEQAALRLREVIDPARVRAHEPMKLHTTFRVGGPADLFLTPATVEEAARAIAICREYGLPMLITGNGSNLLVRDGGIRGAVLHFGRDFRAITADDTHLTAQAGALLPEVAAEAWRLGLTGMEFASGIPGSVGGAVAMNAGAYGGQMADLVECVTATTPEGDIVEYCGPDLRFGYRHSRVQDERLIVLTATLGLQRGDLAESRRLIDEYTAQRQSKQPLEKPSAGSFFKRPPGFFAGKLIEDAGLKGLSVGRARVSEKHAGFLVNDGGDSAADVLALADEVRRRVRERFGVELECEVRIVGED